jgi:hydrophobe/amphiphile efflux-1 (HAE1) family protein
MRFSRFFIDRPIFAAVISTVIVLMGAFSYPFLPLSQYPEIAPPSVVVNAFNPGASAETLAETVAAPLEQEINGVEGMLYMMSSSTSDGAVALTVTFRPGTDLDEAQVLVQNRVALAEPRLPEQVRQIGVSVAKQATGFLMFAALTSTDDNVGVDYIGNYANTVLRDRLLRVDGVGGVQVFGGGFYSMRVWIDPGKAAARNLTAGEIVQALASQNVQVAGGAVGAPPVTANSPAFQLPLQVQGRLATPEEFGDVVLKTDVDGRMVRLRDVARIELGAQDYSIKSYFSGRQGVALAIIQQPGSNALDAANSVIEALDEASKNFPPGIAYSIPYNPTEYVQHSVDAVEHTLIEAIILVVLVVVVFLQTWRAAIIPIVAIPVSLVGTFAIQLALGYSINSLSLFALVLAVGIVVDDAIVVVENVERNMRLGLTPREAAVRTMEEVSGALIAIGLVLMAVFVPTALVPGIPGIFYRQFAVTIAAASTISLIVSLTLSPALAALLLKPHEHGKPTPGWLKPVKYAGDKFNAGFEWLSEHYGRLTARLVRLVAIVLVLYVALVGLTGWRLMATPQGFIPDQDQGYLIGVIDLPPGSSLERTDAVLKQVAGIVEKTPGVELSAGFAGLNGATFSAGSNSAVLFAKLDSHDKRKSKDLAAGAIAGRIMGEASNIQGATVFVLAPPAVEGLGNGSGFMMMVQDRSNAGYKALEGAAFGMMMNATKEPRVQQVFTQFNTGTPRITADVDRQKAQILGVQPSSVFQALGTYLGSTYINDFNYLGRTYRVTAQAEAAYRDNVADIAQLKVRSDRGGMTPIGSVANLREDTGPARVVRYNMFPAAEVQGLAGPGVSSGDALNAMEEMAAKTLPPGFGFEWTALAYQQKTAASSTGVFALAVVVVFLVLAAQYEAFTLAAAVVFIVPMCVLAALIGVNLRGQDNNILTQIGLIVLVALAAKNAILIVEFAKQAEDHEGMNRFEAAVAAARTRLRPILMTSIAFILGVLPLAVATGPGAEMRQAMGTAVFAGMLGVTLFGLIFTPVFYVIARWIAARLPKPPPKPREYPTTGGGTPHDPVLVEGEG